MLLSNPFSPDPRVYREAKVLVNEGYRVTVLCWDRTSRHPPRQRCEGIDIVRISLRGYYGKGLSAAPHFLNFYRAVYAYLARTPFDILHCHDLDTLPIGFLIARLKKRKIVFDAHEPQYYIYLPQWVRRLSVEALEKSLSRRVDRAIVTNRPQLLKFQALKSKEPTIVANYPDASWWREMPSRRISPTPTIGWIGGMRPESGIEELLEVFSLLLQRGWDVRLLLVGGIIGTIRHILDDARKQYGNRILVREPVPYHEVPRLYRNIDITLMLYRPNQNYRMHTAAKLFECMASGVPVLVADVGETSEIVRRTRCGIVLKSYDIEEIADVVERVFNDRALYGRMSEHGRRAFGDEYNWGKDAQKLLDVYNSL